MRTLVASKQRVSRCSIMLIAHCTGARYARVRGAFPLSLLTLPVRARVLGWYGTTTVQFILY